MLEKSDNALHANDDMLFYVLLDKFTFISCQRHILIADLDKINLDDDNNLMKMVLMQLFMSDF